MSKQTVKCWLRELNLGRLAPVLTVNSCCLTLGKASFQVSSLFKTDDTYNFIFELFSDVYNHLFIVALT